MAKSNTVKKPGITRRRPSHSIALMPFEKVVDRARWEDEVHDYLYRPKNARTFFARASEILKKAFGITDFAFLLCRDSGDVHKHCWSWPEKDRQLYVAEKLSKHDFMLSHALLSNEGVFQGEIVRQCKTLSFENPSFIFNAQIFDMVQSMGFADYYNIGFDPTCSANGDEKGRAIFCVAAKGVSEDEFYYLVGLHKEAIALFGKIFDKVGHRRGHGFSFQNPIFGRLNGTEKHVLESLACRDATKQELAIELNISLSGVNKAIYSAISKMDVQTSLRAAVTAMQRGEIGMMEDREKLWKLARGKLNTQG